MSPRVSPSEVTPDTSDEALMERFRGGEAAALEALFTRHSRGVHGFLVRMVRDEALAEDLLQQTFLSVVRSVDRFQRGAKVWPWLLTIAANAARGSLRHQRQGVEVLGEEPGLEPSVTPTPSDPGARKRIEAAFAAMPASQREVVLLHKVEGLSFEEIAGMLGITSTAAGIRAHRGYEFLRPLLEGLS